MMSFRTQALLLFTILVSTIQSLPSIGYLDTTDIHSRSEAYEINAAYIDHSCNPVGPGFTVANALTTFWMSPNDGNVIGRAFSGTAKPDGSGWVSLIRGWGGSKIAYAKTAFLILSAADQNEYDVARWNLNVYGSGLVPHENSKQYYFNNYYAQPPRVALFVNAISQFWGSGFRFKTYADNIDEYGFTLHMDSWADTYMSGGGVTWIAYPAGKPGVIDGIASTGDYRSWQDPATYNSGYVTFPPGFYSSTPQVFVGISYFDMDDGHDFRLSVYADNVSQNGFTWHCDGYDNTVIYMCSVSWLAFA